MWFNVQKYEITDKLHKFADCKLFKNIMTQDELFKVLVAHCKEYGFIFPSSEIYDGLAAVYDYGQNGVELKNNIKQYWWNAMTRLNENIVGIDSCIFMHPKTWVASGHVAAFNDPLIDNKDSKKRYRADNLIEDYLGKIEEKISVKQEEINVAEADLEEALEEERAQYELMKKSYGFPPMLLLDDVFDKLDMGRISNLLSMVAGQEFGQIFISDSNKIRLQSIVDKITEDRAYFETEAGNFTKTEV